MSPIHCRPPAGRPPALARARHALRHGLPILLFVLIAPWFGCSEERSDAGPRPGTPVVVSRPFLHEFADRIEALGTTRASESVVITARVAETVERVHFEDGQRVDEGDILVTFEQDEERARLAGARADLRDARLRFERVADLRRSGTESQSRFDEVRSALQAAEARVAEIEARLEDLTIRAPFAGVLGLREVSPGSLVQPGDRITTLDAIDRIQLDFTVPETFLSILSPGLEVETQSAAYPDRRFVGRILAIDNRVDPTTRAIRVRAEIDNSEHRLRPGMLLTLELRANPTESLALVEEALVPRGASQFVVVLDDEDRARRVEVLTGRRAPGIVEIRSGLSPGARVVIDGASLVPPGGRVRVLREDPPPSA